VVDQPPWRPPRCSRSPSRPRCATPTSSTARPAPSRSPTSPRPTSSASVAASRCGRPRPTTRRAPPSSPPCCGPPTRDPALAIRAVAATGLGQIGAPELLTAIPDEWFTRSDPDAAYLRECAAIAWTLLGEAARPVSGDSPQDTFDGVLARLREGLREGQPELRFQCAAGVAQLVGADAEPDLVAALARETVPQIRGALVTAIGELDPPGPAACDLLAPLCDDPHTPTAFAAALALTAARDPRGGPQLLRALGAPRTAAAPSRPSPPSARSPRRPPCRPSAASPAASSPPASPACEPPTPSPASPPARARPCSPASPARCAPASARPSPTPRPASISSPPATLTCQPCPFASINDLTQRTSSLQPVPSSPPVAASQPVPSHLTSTCPAGHVMSRSHYVSASPRSARQPLPPAPPPSPAPRP
jgi:hypothetical protein